MPHHDYPVGWVSPVPAGYAPGETEYELLWDQLYGSINGDTGGTWAPTDFVRVGGSGFSFAGTGHEVASSARITIQTLGEIRTANGGLIRLDGSGSNIDLKVSSNIPIIEVGSTGRIDLLLGGALDAYGTVTFKNTSGPGAAVWQNNTTATFQSGAVATFANGAELELASGSTVDLSGQMTVGSSGGITIASSGAIVGQSGSSVALSGTNVLSSLALVGASTWPTLNTARTVTRPGVKIIPLTYNHGAGAGPGNADAWEALSNTSNAPAFRTSAALLTGDKSIIEVTDLPIGTIITGATIISRGTELGSILSTLPNYRIVSWINGDVGLSNHSNQTNDAGTQLTFAITDTTTTIGVIGATSDRTVTAGRRYGILMEHPFEAINSQGVWIYLASIEGTLAVIQS
jgi:hypothetical protein